jgi:hypothetical protein
MRTRPDPGRKQVVLVFPDVVAHVFEEVGDHPGQPALVGLCHRVARLGRSVGSHGQPNATADRRASATGPRADPALVLSGDLRLEVFCDTDDDAYVLRSDDDQVIVGELGRARLSRSRRL